MTADTLTNQLLFLSISFAFALCLIGTLAAVEKTNIILIFTDGNERSEAYEFLRSTGVRDVTRRMMTGSYLIHAGEPRNLKRLHTVPHPDEVTIAEVLKSTGYATGIIGKWHLAKVQEDSIL